MKNIIYDCILYSDDFGLLNERLRFTNHLVKKQIIFYKTKYELESLERLYSEKIDLVQFENDYISSLVDYFKSNKIDLFNIVVISKVNEFPDLSIIEFEPIINEDKVIVCSQKICIGSIKKEIDLSHQSSVIFSVNYLMFKNTQLEILLSNPESVNDNTKILIKNGHKVLNYSQENSIITKFLKKESLFPHPHVDDFIRLDYNTSDNNIRKKPKIYLVDFDSTEMINLTYYDDIISMDRMDTLTPKTELYDSNDFVESFFINESKHKMKSLYPLDIDVFEIKYKNKLITKTWLELKDSIVSELVLN